MKMSGRGSFFHRLARNGTGPATGVYPPVFFGGGYEPDELLRPAFAGRTPPRDVRSDPSTARACLEVLLPLHCFSSGGKLFRVHNPPVMPGLGRVTEPLLTFDYCQLLGIGKEGSRV